MIPIDIFNNLVKTKNQTLLIVTQDSDFANKTQLTIEMVDGKIINKTIPSNS